MAIPLPSVQLHLDVLIGPGASCHPLAQQDSQACFRLSHGHDGWRVRAGVLDLKQAQEWVVTTKLGASDKRPGTQVCIANRILEKEPCLALPSLALSCLDSLCSGRGQAWKLYRQHLHACWSCHSPVQGGLQ